MKKNLHLTWKPPQKLKKTIMRLSLLFTSLLLFALPAEARAQQMTIHIEQGTLDHAFQQIMEKSDVQLVYNTDVAAQIECPDMSFEETEFSEILSALLADTHLEYKKSEEVFIISSKAQQQQAQEQEMLPEQESLPEQEQPLRRVVGKVFDATTGEELPFVTVIVKGTTTATAASEKGEFAITVPSAESVLQFSFVGYETLEVRADLGREMNIRMKLSVSSLTDVIVTGLYSREKTQTTGSATTYSIQELKKMGNQNVLSSLKTLDPSFTIVENNLFGSDPNRLPDIEIRGKTSVIGLSEEYGTDPNQPLFILDGFESTLRVISDLSMDMIESITILKDAASTAIYGSKSANGVVVVETRKPTMGQLRVNYGGNFNVSFPDLSDYNLMNAREKLEFERLSLRWGTLNEDGSFESEDNFIDYMRVYKDIERGVDTYWLHLPVRIGFTNRHNLYVEGGAPEIRYGIGVNYGNTQGVMKDSNRETISGNFRLMYRKNRFSFNNILNVDNVTANREKVAFSRFAKMNPYLRRYDENGDIPKIQRIQLYGSGYTYSNPYWDMYLNSLNKTTEFGFSNNLEIEWRILNELRVRGRLGIGKTAEKQVIFKSPFHTDFVSASQELTGTYQQSNGDSFNYTGDASIIYGKLLNEVHNINVVAGFNFNENNSTSGWYNVSGFIDDNFPNPNFALGYVPDSKPGYSEAKRRSASYYITAGYAYNQRYLIDASYRLDGTSIFGSNKRFSQTWSVGLAWNIHNEVFMKESNLFNNLRLRASMGNPGNQNFSDYISLMIYKYNLDNPNLFGPSMTVDNFGNANLDWQKTIDKNIGFDLGMLRNRLRLNFDYFHKVTDPLLVYIGTPSSTGVTTIPKNMGAQVTMGMTLQLNYQIISNQNITWSVNANMRHITSHYENIGDQLNKYNLENYGSSLVRYYDNGSPNDLWAVRSLGIDPATGREILLKKDGTPTFLYDYADEVVVGNTEPDIDGVFGTYFRYKGFTAGFSFRYRYGGQAFMSALYNKVENINDRFDNQDKRALYDRWKEPGDQAKFKGLWVFGDAQYRMSSRFVMDNNILSGESINISYETSALWLRHIGASSLNVSAYMNDIFRLSTIKDERGIDYPFARSVSFSIGLRF